MKKLQKLKKSGFVERVNPNAEARADVQNVLADMDRKDQEAWDEVDKTTDWFTVDRLFQGLNDMADIVWDTSEAKGFKDRFIPLSESIANIHGEVSELWEAYRTEKLNEPCDKADKMEAVGLCPLTCLEEELADIVIRALDTAVDNGVDIEEAVRIKNAFNRTREKRHGGKVA